MKNRRLPLVGLLVLCLVAAPAALAACPGGCSMLAACDHSQEHAGPQSEAGPDSHHGAAASVEAQDSHQGSMPACHGAMEPEADEGATSPLPPSPEELLAAGCCYSGEGNPASSVALKSPSPTQLTDASLAVLATTVLNILPPTSFRRPLRPPAPDGGPPGRLLVLHQAFLL